MGDWMSDRRLRLERSKDYLLERVERVRPSFRRSSEAIALGGNPPTLNSFNF